MSQFLNASVPKGLDAPAPIAGEIFHPGERALQAYFNAWKNSAHYGVRAIQPLLAPAQATFLGSLRLVAVGACDPSGDVWASVLFGECGFVTACDASTLRVAARLHDDDPLRPALEPNTPVGLLGIDLGRRRRIRVNGYTESTTEHALCLRVAQAYGNCSQYIWPREHPDVTPAPGASASARAFPISLQDPVVRLLIARADTFFIASIYEARPDDPAHIASGADVSHRGGRPGFLAIEDDVLTWPEYVGNAYFNTLGNLLVDGRCGLLVPDFESGMVLQVQGQASIVQAPATTASAEHQGLAINCRVRLKVHRAVIRPCLLPRGWPQLGRAATKDIEL
ncbi:MAG: hypothetical protein B7X31_10655 [Thiomonas sp. 13-66-29]|jgi:predicted pyridoxine 5'-phosphate oxidase superfamily flavin-nucleotide-binding protein|nr:MAG: hypothetical protein B7X31_10655 [Thiomonas sp. 13-66-29]